MRRCPPDCPCRLRLPTHMSLSSAGCTSTAPASPDTCARRRVPISPPTVWALHGQAAVCAARLTEQGAPLPDGPDSFLVALLLYLIRDDLPYIQQLETRLTDLEQAVLDNDTGRFLHRMSVIRKELNRTNRYYAQLCDFASTLLEDAEEQLSGRSKKRLNHFLRKVENLRGETRMLHEYATQISSEYQAQVDIDQNRVMKVLTIVTAIFLPLTLIAGWYGMNFPNILLLGWRYGYAAVAIVSALVVVLLIWYFKRKKWF